MKRKKIFVFFCMLILIIWAGTSKEQGQKRYESVLPWIKEMEEDKTIRVLLKSEGYQEITHNKICVSAENGIRITSGEKEIQVSGNEIYEIHPDCELFQKGSIKIETLQNLDKIYIHSLQRGYGTAYYCGTLELFSTAEGIVMVNELPVELYLEHVVPSEMPASYEMEALKAQAVCARSYAYRQVESMAYPEYRAHVDDSTSFQVYGNSAKNEKTSKAVFETEGEVLWYENEVIVAYFFSTSCGKTAGIEAWNEKNADKYPYLKSVAITDADGEDYEENLPWYRWNVTVSKEQLKNGLELYAGIELGVLEKLIISKVGDGGIVLEIRAAGSEGEIVVSTENKIRKALGYSSYQINRNDGGCVQGSDLLPSAFFTIEENGETYIIHGGGYGHGIGMSQNGANEMAKEGANYKEILQFFYHDVCVE